MSNQAKDKQTEKRVLSKAELLERNRHYRAILEETVQNLDEEKLGSPGPEKWSIKDHLAHITVWEKGVVALLNRQPRFKAMGVEQAFQQGRSETEINEMIFMQNKDSSRSEVLTNFKQVHTEMLQLLEKLSESDLHRPYSDFVPGGDPTRRDPVILWVIGNTYAHFDEHTAYIRQLLEAE